MGIKLEWPDYRGEGREPDPEEIWKRQQLSWKRDSGGTGFRRLWRGTIRRTVVSAVIFGLIWGFYAAQPSWGTEARRFIGSALNQDMDFTAARDWYARYFGGAPAFIPIFGEDEGNVRKVTGLHTLAPPLAGRIVQPFAVTLKGIEIEATEMQQDGDTEAKTPVASVDVGRVLAVSREAQGGYRVTVQHSGGLEAEYGHLTGTVLKADDWLQEGEAVGWLEERPGEAKPLLYFALKQGPTYIDPSDEIAFD
ncbi:M23 family metallopeptidase [Paenibacillus spiritus]|uniref:M23 family metallopeptidase n=1 Tax=Paenibacillus spiritus TaxID=2496557 RepID=A0A5J5G1H9_9BACL|nr:M23 family metallopeptidase [Paenibacillus spiritus]KAA9000409.1 M23 family metallopeptidase [Paenibacillus spiritus]